LPSRPGSASSSNGVLERTAGVTALYIESFVEPQIASLATNPILPPPSVDALDRLLESTQLGERVVSFRVWTPDGGIVYSPNRELIGQQFTPEGGLARALTGDVSAEMTDLSGPENAYERERWSRLVETYVPVRAGGGGTIIAVTEFYQLPDEIDAEVASARAASWAVVALAAIVSYLLLAGIVRQGSDTIERQQGALRERVAELSRLLDQNARLHGRLRRAADRTTALNEAGLRRIGSDLHDGPAQTLALALLRLDELEGGEVVSGAVSSALGDLRLIASGLRSPSTRCRSRRSSGAPPASTRAGPARRSRWRCPIRSLTLPWSRRSGCTASSRKRSRTRPGTPPGRPSRSSSRISTTRSGSRFATGVRDSIRRPFAPTRSASPGWASVLSCSAVRPRSRLASAAGRASG
jgi:hypothetical protein